MLKHATLVAVVALLAACESGEKTGPADSMPASQPAMGILNDACPIMGGDVDPETKTVDYMGAKIGFCCAGCVGKWDEMSDAAKEQFVAKYR